MTAVPAGGLHYRVDGAAGAPAILLCNSLGTDLRMWEPQVAALTGRFRVVRFDMRGHGHSATPAGEYTLDDLGGDAEAVLDAAGVEQADICGESLGGVVALWLAIHRADRVNKVVLANSAARVGTSGKWQERIDTVRAGGMSAISDMVIGRFFSEQFRANRPDVVGDFRRMLDETDPEGYAGCCAALRDADLRDATHVVTAPALVLAGAHDVATPVSNSQWLQEHLAGSRLQVLDAAHLSSVECAGEFNAAVAAFLVTG
ncbi:MAG: 3-oxoadipate enol-lactonase [Nitriliruptorales bacterium]|nr:3-oxoadipate enol-lactonase [Nitriliruptorales bacterium]